MIKVTWTKEKKDIAIKMLTEWFEEYGGIGESIMQSDRAIISAPELLADIADDVLIQNEGIIYIPE